MLNFCLSYQWLRWTPPTGPPPSLPDGVDRLFVKTPGGPLELLYCRPQDEYKNPQPSSPPPLLFVHGGMGSAWVWLEYMQYLAVRGIPCYAVSLRGHGESYHPSFWRMVYGTTKRMLADDVIASVRWVQERESQKVVLAGHSSGGGLCQFVLSEQDIHVQALVLIAAVPGFGSMRVYMNWWLLDPLFTVRMFFHGFHPNSPLSHPWLTKRVFFSSHVSGQYVEKFQRHINAYESLLWPMSMMTPFVRAERLLHQVSGWEKGQRILVLRGGEDKLMTGDVMRQLAMTYRTAVCSRLGQEQVSHQPDIATVRPLLGEGDEDDDGQGVRFCLVPGAGHHLQNDVQWETGAQKLLEFYKQL